MSQKAELAYTVGNAHQYHSFLSKLFPIVTWFGSRSKAESTTVNPYKHRYFLVGRFGRCPDIQVQAVLTLSGRRVSTLHGGWSKLCGLLYATPFGSRLWCFPPQITNMWCSKRNAFVN